MPIPPGVEVVLGPLLDTTGALVPATPELRDYGAISLRGRPYSEGQRRG